MSWSFNSLFVKMLTNKWNNENHQSSKHCEIPFDTSESGLKIKKSHTTVKINSFLSDSIRSFNLSLHFSRWIYLFTSTSSLIPISLLDPPTHVHVHMNIFIYITLSDENFKYYLNSDDRNCIWLTNRNFKMLKR